MAEKIVTKTTSAAEDKKRAIETLRMMRASGFGDVQIVKDLNGIPRVVFGTLCDEI